MNLLEIQPYIQMIINIGTLAVMLYTLKTFLGRPHDDLLARIVKLESKVEEHDRSLDNSWEEHRSQKDTNEAIQTAVLAIVDFELTFCSHADYKIDTTDLEEAKTILRRHLGKK